MNKDEIDELGGLRRMHFHACCTPTFVVACCLAFAASFLAAVSVDVRDFDDRLTIVAMSIAVCSAFIAGTSFGATLDADEELAIENARADAYLAMLS